MGAERGGLHEEALGTQSAVDLIGGHLQILLALFPSLGVGVVPSLLGTLQQVDGAHHVALDENFGVLDGAVNMALGGEVDDIVEIVLCEQALDQLLVADVALHKDVAGVALNVLQVLKIAGIGQLVEVDQQNFRVLLEHIMHEVGTDKTGTAGDKIFFHNQIFLLNLSFHSVVAVPVLEEAGQRVLPVADIVADGAAEHPVVQSTPLGAVGAVRVLRLVLLAGAGGHGGVHAGQADDLRREIIPGADALAGAVVQAVLVGDAEL